MKCANCSKDSLFEYQITISKSVFYCGVHLPKFLEARKRAGLLKLTDKFEEAKDEALSILAIKVPSEEFGSEEETPKPKKKASKKKAE